MTSSLTRSNLLICRDANSLARLAASFLLVNANNAIRRKNCFDLVLSGGSTPKRMYELLASEFAHFIPWLRVRFFWGDERAVLPDHPESNFRMAYETLLKPLRIPSENIFRVQTEIGTAQAAASQYETTLKRLWMNPDFDLVLLGLGEDGHTASLFPDAWSEWLECEKRGQWVCAPWVPHLQQRRITLLPRILNSARKILFLVSGSEKSDILREVLDREVKQPPRFPAQLIHTPHGRALWLVDRPAATTLAQAA